MKKYKFYTFLNGNKVYINKSQASKILGPEALSRLIETANAKYSKHMQFGGSLELCKSDMSSRIGIEL